MPINKGNSQAGLGQLALILLLLAGIGLGTYLVQQRTNILPFAATTDPPPLPAGCDKIRQESRTTNDSYIIQSGDTSDTREVGQQGQQITSKWSGGWTFVDVKSPLLPDGDRVLRSSVLKKPDGTVLQSKKITSNPTAGYNVDQWQGGVIVYTYFVQGINNQGVAGLTDDESKSFAYVPKSGTTTNCIKAAGVTTTSTTTTSTTTNRDLGASCKKSSECKSVNCGSNGVCVQGTRKDGGACVYGDQCVSKVCTGKICAKSTSSTTSSTTSSSSRTTSSTSTTATSTTAVPSTAIALKKSDITGFRNRFRAISGELEKLKDSVPNLKIVLNIANNDLNDLADNFVPKCPDGAEEGKCLEPRRARFDYAKTSARLASFYGIYNGAKGVCAKVDFGVMNDNSDDLIYAKSKSSTPTDGRVNLCSNPAGVKLWRVLDNTFNQLEIDPADTRWKPDPKCDDLTDVVKDHLRRAEKLFEKESGFVKNSPCTGK